jgi:two-component system, OmpR family, sensor histidine kinase KdpD
VLCVAAVTGAIYVFREAVPVLSLGALYLFAVLPVAVLWGRLYAIGVAVASMLAFNFFFLPPQHTFRLEERTNWFALAVYLATGLVVSELATRARQRAAEAEQREREEALLAELSIALLQGERLEGGLDAIARAVARIMGVTSAHLELGEHVDAEAPRGLELRAGNRLVGKLSLPGGEELDASVRNRFLPAFSTLLAVAIDREALERAALAAERLRLSDSIKTAILRSVSHDLRTPLTAIRVAGESLASPALELSGEDRARLLATIEEESRRLDRLVANLLDLSRLQAGAVTSRRELVAVDELVGQALAELRGRAASVSVHLPDDVPLVEVDTVQVERALVNVLENALRFSPPDEDVVVRATASTEEVALRIENHGPALAEDDLERIFEPFEGVGDGERQGTGLGLAIARGFTEANGGRIWAESKPLRGVSFAMAFPRATSRVRVQT